MPALSDPFLQKVKKPVIAGPCWRLELGRNGWPADQPIELAVLNKSSLIRHIADATLDAGATLLLTPTETAHGIAIEPNRSSDERLPEANRAACCACAEAIAEHGGTSLRLVGVLGPCERLLALDEIRPETLEAAYAAQVEVLADAGVQAIACRHFSELGALLCAVRASSKSGLPVIACLTFDSGLASAETALGATIPQACAALAELDVQAIGCDDGDNADAMPGLIAKLRDQTSLPIWAGLAAGGPQIIEGAIVYPETPSEYSARLGPVVTAGAHIIGLGAGASVDHLRSLATPRRERK